MLQRIWYTSVKIYITVSLYFFFKKIYTVGKNNIPKKGAVLFVANHKNALIDPLLIATISPRNIYFLTRASAFKKKFVKWILSTVNMMPIYRMRDGKESLAKNEEIFNQCYTILDKGNCLLIFPEGTHDLRRLVRPLSKGFTRIVFGFLDQYPQTNLQIVPVGLNYTDATKHAESVSVYFGEPILANSYYKKDDINTSTNALKEVVWSAMKELTASIPIDTYDETLEKMGSVDFLNPKLANQRITDVTNCVLFEHVPNSPSVVWKIAKFLFTCNSFVPLQLYRFIEPSIKEREFISTTKFAIGAAAFPLFYLLQTGVVSYFLSSTTGLIYLITSILLGLLVVKTK